MLFFALVASIFALASAKPRLNKHCSKELAEIVFDPCNTWSAYLRSISTELKDIASFYDLDQGTNMILTFQNKYGVTVSLYEPFNEVLHYAQVSGPNDVTELSQSQFDHNNARSGLNLGSYYQNSTHYVYTFLSFTSDAQSVQVSIAKGILTPLPFGG